MSFVSLNEHFLCRNFPWGLRSVVKNYGFAGLPAPPSKEIWTISLPPHTPRFASVLFLDIDECKVNNGGCQQRCVNTVGSYQCLCQAGFVLDEDARKCIGKMLTNFMTTTAFCFPDYCRVGVLLKLSTTQWFFSRMLRY